MAKSSTNQNFTYPLINHEPIGFRLLRVVPSHEGAIECELRSFPLDHQPQTPWSALSYCWGEDEATLEIRVNSQPFFVRRNLHSFLTQLARAEPDHLKRVEWVFIDAICIDQSNLAERTAQVMAMGDIYHHADLVIAWLYDENGSCKAGSSERAVMSAVTENGYWKRLWIVQEMLLAQSLTIIVGQNSFTGSDVLRYIERTDKHGIWGRGTKAMLERPAYSVFMVDALNREFKDKNIAGLEEAFSVMAAVRILEYLRRQSTRSRSKNAFPFHEAINTFSAQLCRVTHDKVFALLGITDSRIVPNYALSLIELYAQLLASYLISLGFEKASDLTALERMLKAAEHDLHGHCVFNSLGIDPQDPAFLIVTKAVASFFVVPKWGYVLHAALLPVWVRVYKDNPQGNLNALEGRRRWYETKSQMNRRNNKDVLVEALAFAEEAERKVRQMREDDVAVAAPDGGPTHVVSKWEILAQLHCEVIWIRHLRDKKAT